MKKVFFILTPIIVAAMAIGGIVYLKSQDEHIVGNDVDENGCITSAGYTWCEAREVCMRFWEEKCNNDHMRESVDLVARSINETLSQKLIDPQEVQIDWYYQDEKDQSIGFITIDAIAYTIESATDEAYQAIRSSLIEQRFEHDMYNIASGTVAGLEGFQHGIQVCTLAHRLEGVDDLTDVSEATSQTIVLTCGLLNSTNPLLQDTAQALKHVFATMYEIDEEHVTISIEQEAESHIRGMVDFAGTDTALGGIFFAVLKDGQWSIVADENGSFECNSLYEYDFPEEMMQGCIGK